MKPEFKTLSESLKKEIVELTKDLQFENISIHRCNYVVVDNFDFSVGIDGKNRAYFHITNNPTAFTEEMANKIAKEFKVYRKNGRVALKVIKYVDFIKNLIAKKERTLQLLNANI
jgi:hypothetical protein